MIIDSWSVSIRYMWGLPLQTHRHLIEPLGGTHAKTMLYTRFMKFVQSIRKNPKLAPYYLLEKIKDDGNTITGKNLKLILGNEKNDIFKEDIKELAKNIRLCQPEVNNSWKVNIIKELTQLKLNLLSIKFGNNDDTFTKDEIQDMIDFVATC